MPKLTEFIKHSGSYRSLNALDRYAKKIDIRKIIQVTNEINSRL